MNVIYIHLDHEKALSERVHGTRFGPESRIPSAATRIVLRHAKSAPSISLKTEIVPATKHPENAWHFRRPAIPTEQRLAQDKKSQTNLLSPLGITSCIMCRTTCSIVILDTR